MAGIFKAYDVRGLYPSQINEDMARQIGLAFQFVLDEEDRARGNTVVVSRDMRSHSEPLAQALIEGLTQAGLDVLDIGLATTPMNYFAVGHTKAAGGVQVTASHNPAQYNGLKFSRHEARPVSGDHGIPLLEEKVKSGDLPKASRPGTVRTGNVFDDYQKHILGFLHGKDRRLRVVVDAANGMGTIYRPILEATGIELIPLYFELDGSFPNHEANPLKEENLHDLMRAVQEHKADLGVAFDGDADRAAFVDETGQAVGSDLMTALIGGELLEREPGKAVLYDLRSSRAVAEYIEEKGGVPVRERVGHSFMKATLRKREGIFGGELAGHYYFRDHFNADSSIGAVIEILNLLRATGKPLSELVQPLRRYAKSPEINFEVEDKQ
ncbi:MAG TPA: phosphomannomutase/phosphoglucomutase, partial [Thermoanaerobaculia bacterium]